LNAYLATRTGVPVHNMADVIQFNLDHFEQELKWFGQEYFELAQAEIFTEQEYVDALARERSLSREQGIDAALAENNLDALIAPTGSPAWTTDLVNGDHFLGASSFPAAMAGYPAINVNAGFAFGLPIGISFFGTAFSEPALIKLASGFEHVIDARRAPQFRPTIPLPTGDDSLVRSAAGQSSARVQRLRSLIASSPRLRGFRPRFA
jgi:amidase